MSYKLLVINPGSTSTKIAVFDNDVECIDMDVSHDKSELVQFDATFDQLEMRREKILAGLAEKGVDLAQIDCFVGRGGVLPPIPGGVYGISKQMLKDTAETTYGEHACNLACHLAHGFAQTYNKPCFVVDPPSTDEVIPLARVTGLKEVKRRFLTHALSQRGIGRIVAEDLGKSYEDCRFVVAHLGGGISMGAHRNGKIEDAISSYDGEGPFSPERAGAIPALDILDMVEKGYDINKLRKTLTSRSGLWDLLGTSDLREVEEKAKTDERYHFILMAMSYNIAKGIAQMVPLLYDEAHTDTIDGIIITGGMIRCPLLAADLERRLSWIAPLLIYPSTCEMKALAMGGVGALDLSIPVKQYPLEN